MSDQENSSNNTIQELRSMLFDTMRALKPGAKKEDIEAARAQNEIAQTIINSAKVEVDAMRASGGNSAGTGFIPLPAPTGKTQTGRITHPAPGVTKHTMDS